MAEIMLYHHVQGRTEGIEAVARQWQDAGHTVHTPDLFDGETFATLDDGMAHAREVGFATLLDQGLAAAADLGPGLVWAGFSLGVMPAQNLAQNRAGTRGAILVDACLPVEEFGDGWPEDVPVQVHGMDADPNFVDGGNLDAARDLVASTDRAELFLYPGADHLFADASLPSHDPDATALFLQRTLAFLDGLD